MKAINMGLDENNINIYTIKNFLNENKDKIKKNLIKNIIRIMIIIKLLYSKKCCCKEYL